MMRNCPARTAPTAPKDGPRSTWASRQSTGLGLRAKLRSGGLTPGPLLAMGRWLLAAALLTGIALTVVAARGGTTSGAALAAHEWIGFLAAALLGAGLLNSARRA